MILEKPDLVQPHKFDENMKNYYKYDKNEKMHLFVAVSRKVNVRQKEEDWKNLILLN